MKSTILAFLIIFGILFKSMVISSSENLPSLSGLDYETKSSIQLACSLAKIEGPAVYGDCLKKHLDSIK